MRAFGKQLKTGMAFIFKLAVVFFVVTFVSTEEGVLLKEVQNDDRSTLTDNSYNSDESDEGKAVETRFPQIPQKLNDIDEGDHKADGETLGDSTLPTEDRDQLLEGTKESEFTVSPEESETDENYTRDITSKDQEWQGNVGYAENYIDRNDDDSIEENIDKVAQSDQMYGGEGSTTGGATMQDSDNDAVTAVSYETGDKEKERITEEADGNQRIITHTENDSNEDEDLDKTDAELPNIVIFLADDVGIGDIGCFGNDTIRTPYIDSIAARGAKLTQHLTASPTCSPSRAALLTGRYPKRLGLATRQIMSAFPFSSGSGGLPSDEVTFAEIVKRRGYKTALIGKWHLGLSQRHLGDNQHHPNYQGFDYFYGTPNSNFEDLGRVNKPSLVWSFIPHLDWFKNSLRALFVCAVVSAVLRVRNILRTPICLAIILVPAALLGILVSILTNITVWNGIFMRNGDLVEQPIDLTNMSRRLVQEGIEFLAERERDKQPFLLFMSWLQCHTALHATKEFRDRSRHGRYGAEVEEMDWSTGQILTSLQQYGLAKNTFIYFSSDNGGHSELHEDGERAGGHNGVFKGSKAQGGQEGGIRVPTVAMWPGRIAPNTVIDTPTSQMDLLPTLAMLVDEAPPDDRIIDGRNIMPLLKGTDTRSPHEFLFHYCGIWMHAARWSPRNSTDVWKVIYALPNWIPGTYGCSGYACTCRDHHTWLDTPLLFNIAKDPSEVSPLNINDSTYKKIIETIQEAKTRHEMTLTPVENQFDLQRTFFRPWMQLCCNFPRCRCKDKKYLTTLS